MSLQPLPPISRRETALRAVEPMGRRLLTQEEREEARQQREQARRERKHEESERETGGQVPPGHVDYLG